jgi:hypothetical protein
VAVPLVFLVIFLLAGEEKREEDVEDELKIKLCGFCIVSGICFTS